MNELELFLKSASEILKSLSKGASTLSGKIEVLSKGLKEEKRAMAKASKGKTEKGTPKKGLKITAAEAVYNLIKGAKDGADMNYLMKKSGFDRKKVQNIIFKLKKQERIEVKARGIYTVK